MSKEIKEIVFGQGLGSLKFGLTKEQVKNLLGSPDDIEDLSDLDEGGVEGAESWHYEDNGVSIIFDEEYENRAVSFSISDPLFTLHGKSVIGENKSDLLAYFDKLGIEVCEEEDVSDEEFEDMTLIESDELGFIVWFDGEEAIEMQLHPDINEETEEIIWPAN